MPFQRDDLQTLIERARADIKARLSIDGAIVRRSTADIIATENAGSAHLSYGALDFLALQLFVDSANRENLIRIGAFFGLTPNAATFASGTLTATGVDPTPIPLGTFFVRDDAARYESTAGVIMAGGTATVPVTAVLAGDAGNTETAATLNLESPIAGVDTATTVDAPGLEGGNDEESTDDFRARVLEFLRSSPAGGSDTDYIVWTMDVFSDAEVWVFENTPALGQVEVLFVRVDPDGTVNFPSAGEILQVQTALDGLRPATAEVNADAPTDAPLAFNLTIDPDTAVNQTAVDNELKDMIAAQAEAGDGVGRGTIFLSQVYAAIGRAPLTDFTVNAPVADTVPALFELITFGGTTYV